VGGAPSAGHREEEGGDEAVVEGAALPELQLEGVGPLEEADAVVVVLGFEGCVYWLCVLWCELGWVGLGWAGLS